MLSGFVAPLGLAMLFAAALSLVYLIVKKDEPSVQKDSLLLFAILFVFIGVRLLLPKQL
jgi:hypothetical protein